MKSDIKSNYDAMMLEYQIQVENFVKVNNIKLKILGYEYKKYFIDDKECRYVFKCRLTRNKKNYTFKFGQSINNGCKEPTMYDILSCITKYDVGDFYDFCNEFGYYNDDRKAYRIYLASQREYKSVERLFGDIIEQLREIN